MPADDYNTLATVYDWIVPEALTTPAGSSGMFLPYIEGVAPGARVLDCAAGTGPLAVGLAQRGFDVTATDASAPAQIASRTLTLRVGAMDQALGSSLSPAVPLPASRRVAPRPALSRHASRPRSRLIGVMAGRRTL